MAYDNKRDAQELPKGFQPVTALFDSLRDLVKQSGDVRAVRDMLSRRTLDLFTANSRKTTKESRGHDKRRSLRYTSLSEHRHCDVTTGGSASPCPSIRILWHMSADLGDTDKAALARPIHDAGGGGGPISL